MRRSQLVAVCLVLAVLAAAGAGYVGTRSASRDRHPPARTPVSSRSPALAGLTAAAVPAPAGVAAALRPALADPGLGGALTGLVADAVSGQRLFDRAATRPVAPASTLKLLTAAAAIDGLGGAARLTTSVRRDGRTLYLVGGGDVTLAAHPVRGYPAVATVSALARRTAAALSGVNGPIRLRYDATAWSGSALAPGWNADYFTGGDVSRLAPLEVDEGRLRPDKPDRTTDPALQAAEVFAGALQHAAVHVSGVPQPAAAPASAVDVAAVRSPPLSALVQRMLTLSDNDLAEALGRALALHDGQAATFAGAAQALTDHLQQLGVPTSGLRLFDASGLSHRDRVTTAALAAVLRLAVTSTGPLAAMTEGLPVAGLTGTLADRYRHPSARSAAGVVRAKTGTLAGVSALAGQVVDADGRLLVFAFVTDRAASPGPAEAALDRLAARLAGCGCS